MPFRVTKKLLKSLLDEYIGDADKPTRQVESRLSEFFDKGSIVDEMHAVMENIRGIRDEVDTRRLLRLFMHMAEEHANKYKRFKVVSEDVAFAFSSLKDSVHEYLK